MFVLEVGLVHEAFCVQATPVGYYRTGKLQRSPLIQSPSMPPHHKGQGARAQRCNGRGRKEGVGAALG